jgi:hypothetical protein
MEPQTIGIQRIMTAFYLNSETITVWYGLSTFDVIWPYFCEENNYADTMDLECYCNMLQTFLAVELQ